MAKTKTPGKKRPPNPPNSPNEPKRARHADECSEHPISIAKVTIGSSAPCERRTTRSKSKLLWICLECGKHLCGGDQETPNSDAKDHSKLDGHKLFVRANKTETAYCFNCESAVWINMPYVVCGLENPKKYTCSLNAALQCLLVVDPLRDYLLTSTKRPGDMAVALQDIFAEIYFPEDIARKVYKPTMVLDAISEDLGAELFQDSREEDSCEVLKHILERLQAEDPSDYAKFVNRIFGVQQVELTICEKCGQVLNRKYVPLVTVLSLPLTSEKEPSKALKANENKKSCNTSEGKEDPSSESKQSGTVKFSVANSLELLTKKEIMSDDAVSCAKCSEGKTEAVESNKSKRTVISEATSVLVIHMNRTDYDSTGCSYKLNDHVGFSLDLNLNQYMDPRIKGTKGCWYRLIGVVEHIGNSTEKGHYRAYVRGRTGRDDAQKNETWVCASDEAVTSVDLKVVLKSKAYLLFYKKVDGHNSVTKADSERAKNELSSTKASEFDVKMLDKIRDAISPVDFPEAMQNVDTLEKVKWLTDKYSSHLEKKNRVEITEVSIITSEQKRTKNLPAATVSPLIIFSQTGMRAVLRNKLRLDLLKQLINGQRIVLLPTIHPVTRIWTQARLLWINAGVSNFRAVLPQTVWFETSKEVAEETTTVVYVANFPAEMTLKVIFRKGILFLSIFELQKYM